MIAVLQRAAASSFITSAARSTVPPDEGRATTLLAPAPTQASAAPESVRAFWQRIASIDLERCPHCQLGTLRLVQILAPRIRPPP